MRQSTGRWDGVLGERLERLKGPNRFVTTLPIRWSHRGNQPVRRAKRECHRPSTCVADALGDVARALEARQCKVNVTLVLGSLPVAD
eukprot:4302773-Prymnesium_polylepis.1